MPGREMEGDNRYRRVRARKARKTGKRASEIGATLGASKQRKHLSEEPHAVKVRTIREGKQKVIRENSPEPRPGSRD
ncbi:MAG TPA: hypothetical protein VNZ57_01770 [Longimicrobiales bacterium]|nr:hypothetical protein [Longimicrobiales bacterium]